MNPKEKNVIGTYELKPAALFSYDPLCSDVAAHIASIIKNHLACLIVEHIGSTAIPNYDGKGIVDLMVLYPNGHLEDTKETLYYLGFQHQPHKDPFPEDRPMLVGSIAYDERVFQIHVHVIQQGCPEALSTIKFRDRLRKDSNLRRQYVRCKKQILKSGVTDSLEYCRAKKTFIEHVLGEDLK